MVTYNDQASTQNDLADYQDVYDFPETSNTDQSAIRSVASKRPHVGIRKHTDRFLQTQQTAISTHLHIMLIILTH